MTTTFKFNLGDRAMLATAVGSPDSLYTVGAVSARRLCETALGTIHTYDIDYPDGRVSYAEDELVVAP